VPDRDLLPWEVVSEQEPSAVGICLSGGGLRAASFSLGVLQALQQERGLLVGGGSADYLAAVSGGSYTAASFAATAAALAIGDGENPLPPLAEGAPETEYIVSHGRYLLEDGKLRFLWRFASRAILSVASIVVFYLWVADFLSIYNQVARDRGIGSPSSGIVEAGVAALAVVALARIARGVTRAGGILRMVEPLVFLVLLFATIPSLFAFIGRFDVLSDPDRWLGRWTGIGTIAIGFAVAAVIGHLVVGRYPGSVLGSVATLVATWLARFLAFALLALFATTLNLRVRGSKDNTPSPLSRSPWPLLRRDAEGEQGGPDTTSEQPRVVRTCAP
jgi:hypothetical protein